MSAPFQIEGKLSFRLESNIRLIEMSCVRGAIQICRLPPADFSLSVALDCVGQRSTSIDERFHFWTPYNELMVVLGDCIPPPRLPTKHLCFPLAMIFAFLRRRI